MIKLTVNDEGEKTKRKGDAALTVVVDDAGDPKDVYTDIIGEFSEEAFYAVGAAIGNAIIELDEEHLECVQAIKLGIVDVIKKDVKRKVYSIVD